MKNESLLLANVGWLAVTRRCGVVNQVYRTHAAIEHLPFLWFNFLYQLVETATMYLRDKSFFAQNYTVKKSNFMPTDASHVRYCNSTAWPWRHTRSFPFSWTLLLKFPFQGSCLPSCHHHTICAEEGLVEETWPPVSQILNCSCLELSL